MENRIILNSSESTQLRKAGKIAQWKVLSTQSWGAELRAPAPTYSVQHSSEDVYPRWETRQEAPGTLTSKACLVNDCGPDDWGTRTQNTLNLLICILSIFVSLLLKNKSCLIFIIQKACQCGFHKRLLVGGVKVLLQGLLSLPWWFLDTVSSLSPWAVSPALEQLSEMSYD